MKDPCRGSRPTWDSDAHEAKFPRLEETGQAALEMAQEEDAPPKTRAEAEEGLAPTLGGTAFHAWAMRNA